MKLRFIVLFFLLLTAFSCNKSNVIKRADTTGESNVQSDEGRYDYIHKLIYENPSEARTEALRILDTLDKSDRISKIILIKHLGSSYVFETNYPEAIRYYNEALSIAEEINLFSEMAHINNNLGVIYNEIGNYKTAYLFFAEALTNYEKSGIRDKKIGTLNNIGLIYLNLNNFGKARTYFNRALDSTIQPKDTILVVSVLNNIALSYLSEKKYNMALNYLSQAIDLSNKVNNKYGLCISYQLMGNIYLQIDENTEAYNAYQVSIGIADSTNLTYQLASSRLGVANVFLKQGKTKEAFEIAYDVMQLADEQNSLLLKSSVHEVLSDIYQKTGNYSKSLSHYKDHVKAQQEVVNQTIIHQVYDIELNQLDEVNRTQKLELEKKELAISKKNNLLFFTSLTFVMLIIGLYLIYLNRRHRQEVKFQKTVVELTGKKSIAALEAEVQERKRIGQELHDSLGHLLSLAGLYVSVLHKRNDITGEKREELVESLQKTIDEAFDEVRNISHNLAPSLLSERGLKGALKSITDRVNQSTGLSMSFDTFGLNGKMDTLIENTLFRTIQEIVNNTIKHADASRLFIQITVGNNEISLMAEDDGKGFDQSVMTEHSGFGLALMKSRIESLNGTMYIDTNPNRGTIISILIPLSQNNYEPSYQSLNS